MSRLIACLLLNRPGAIGVRRQECRKHLLDEGEREPWVLVEKRSSSSCDFRLLVIGGFDEGQIFSSIGRKLKHYVNSLVKIIVLKTK